MKNILVSSILALIFISLTACNETSVAPSNTATPTNTVTPTKTETHKDTIKFDQAIQPEKPDTSDIDKSPRPM